MATAEVFLTSLALSAFAITAIVLPLYVLGIAIRSLRKMARRRRRAAALGFDQAALLMPARHPA